MAGCSAACSSKESYGAGTLIFGCSGGSDVGGLADQAARRLASDGQGKMYCLAGLGGDVPNMVVTAKAAAQRIVIDGCPVACARKIMDAKGLSYQYYNLKDYGFEKGSVGDQSQAVNRFMKAMGDSQ